MVINEAEAVIIRRIYSLYLEGYTPHRIAKTLTADGIPAPGGKAVWHQHSVQSILTNEKYKGDALLQKSYTVDFLTKKKKVNEGEIPQYYVENSHPHIVEPIIFEMVQREIERRKKGGSRHSGVWMFASRIKCGQRSSWFGAKVWHSNSKYRRTIYQCNHKFKNKEKCATPHLDEEAIKGYFVSAVNKLLTDKDMIIANFMLMRDSLFDTEALEAERSELQSEMAIAAELIQKCIGENARIAFDQREYQERYNALVERYETAKTRFDEISERVSGNLSRREMVEAFAAFARGKELLLPSTVLVVTARSPR